MITVISPLQCGSCWAFSVVGALQSVHAIGGSQLTELSVQQVLDCSFQNKGCSGGSPFQALNWLKQVCFYIIICLSKWSKVNTKVE